MRLNSSKATSTGSMMTSSATGVFPATTDIRRPFDGFRFDLVRICSASHTDMCGGFAPASLHSLPSDDATSSCESGN